MFQHFSCELYGERQKQTNIGGKYEHRNNDNTDNLRYGDNSRRNWRKEVKICQEKSLHTGTILNGWTRDFPIRNCSLKKKLQSSQDFADNL